MQSIKDLIKKKAEGDAGTEAALAYLAQIMPEFKFRMFCVYVRNGKNFLNQFRRARIGVVPVKVDLRMFAMRIIWGIRRRGDRTSPHGCVLPLEQQQAQLERNGRHRLKEFTLDNMFGANFGDPHAVRQVRYVYCVGCPAQACLNHLDPRRRTTLVQIGRDSARPTHATL